MPKHLDADMIALCEKIKDSCLETGARIEACIACGLDLQEEQQANNEQLQVVSKMLGNRILNPKVAP